MNGEIKVEVVQKLLEKQSSSKLVVSSFKVFKLTRKNCRKQIILFVIALIPSILIGISSDTISILIETTQTILEVVLALFGIVFTGYSFFQALINRELLVRMVENSSCNNNTGEEKSKLQETNESFVECMMLNLFSVIFTLLLKIVISCIPEDFLLFNKLIYNNLFASGLILIYMYSILTVIWEVKSFIFNIFQLFNAYAGTRVLELFRNDNK